MEELTSPWWGKFSLQENTTAYWRVGPLEIWIMRTAKEWRIGTFRDDTVADPDLVVNNADASSLRQADERVEWQRFGFRRTAETIVLTPHLASRPLVVKPETKFVLPQKEETTMYISSPLWIQFELGKSPSKVLEAEITRLSDTWFGPSTMDGEICYAMRTRARLRLEELDVPPHRAISAFHIQNRAKTVLVMDRLKLPMPNLSLYTAADGRLWTEAVTLDRHEDGDLAELQLAKGPPPNVQSARLLQGPRSKAEKGLLIRAFGGLFG